MGGAVDSFDAFILGLVALVAGIGAWKGFAWLLGVTWAPIAGLSAGWPLSAGLGPQLGLRAPLDRMAAFAILYALITLLVYLAAVALKRRLEEAQLGGWDRHLGFVFGAVKGIVLALLVTAAALSASKDLRARLPATRSGELMAKAVRAVRPALPRAALELLGPWFEVLAPTPAQRRNA
jgi:membrane protein required for colicin V production